MQTGLLYANLTTLELRGSLDGAAFSWPKIVAGSALTIQFRLARDVEGTSQLAADVIHSLKASLGRVDRRPETGGYQLKIGSAGSGNVTALLQYNATADQIATAINALTDVSVTAHLPCTVALDDGSYRIRFADGDEISGGITCPENALWPVAFVEINQVDFDEASVYELRLTEAPIAQAVTFAALVPSPPSVTELRAGGSSDDILWNEVQKLSIPPDFTGAFIIKRGFAATKPIGLPTSGTEIAEALKALADEGGAFGVTEEQDAVLIEFQGSMGGIDQDDLVIEVFDEATGAPTFVLDTKTAGMFALMRRANSNGELALELDIELELEDAQDDEIYRIVHFRAPVVFIAAVSQDDQNVAADLVWNKPPAGTRYTPFSDDELLIGHRSYGAIRGNGSATSFVINHNLDTGYLRASVRETASGGAELINGTDYTVAYDNANTATFTFLGGAPATNSVLITVEGTQQPATYEAHTHPISEITDLQTTLDALGAAITAINARLGLTTLSTTAAGTTAPGLSWKLPKFAELFGARGSTENVGKDLTTVDPATLPSKGGGLYAAVHATPASATALPVPLVAGTPGTLYQNQSGDTVILPGGYGHRSRSVLDDGYAAYDGRQWYALERYAADEEFASYPFSSDASTERIATTAGIFSEGDYVIISSTGTLPAGLSAGGYWLVDQLDDDQFKLSNTQGGAPLEITNNGTGIHSMEHGPGSSFYPTDFNRELFFLAVNDAELRPGFMFELFCGLELGLFKPESRAQYVLVIEHGAFSDDLTPPTTGQNLAAITWNPTPLLSQRIMLTTTPVTRTFGCRVKRSSGGTLTSQKIIFGSEAAGDSVPASANFALRARLIRFDTEDSISTPRGYIGILGLDKSADQSADTTALGTATIKVIA